MAIVSSTIRIYAADQVTLVATEVTQGAATSIPIDSLVEGSEYYATAQVTDDSNLTSAESPQFEFYTLPDVSYFSAPVASANTISAQLDGITNDVAIDYYGLAYDTSSSFNNPSYTSPSQQGAVDITGLSENTTYYVRPYVIDEFSRRWVGTDQRSVSTSYSVPTIDWVGLSTVGSDSFTANVNITSTTSITNAYVQITQVGGSTTTGTLTAQTGVQQVNVTGLSPNTAYQIRVYATNAGGSGTSTVQNITTNAASIEVTVTSATVSPSNNIISAESRATIGTGITITNHSLEMYYDALHSGNAVESYNGGANATINNNFGHADPDETYYIFGKVTYTVAGDANTYVAWSTGYQVDTYSLLTFGTITTTNNSASIPYSVQGTASSIDIQYSEDQLNWITLSWPSLTSGTCTASGLTPNTQYYLKGRCRSTAGWSSYFTDTFTTTQVLPVVNVTGVSNITPVSADVNISVS